MTLFRIKTQDEMNKPFGKCVRLLEDLQFYRQRVEPTDDPKWFRRIHPDITASEGAPRLEMTSAYLEGRVTNLGCLSMCADFYWGWFFRIEHEGHVYQVPQRIVDLPDKCGTNYRLLARTFYDQVGHENDRAKLWAEKLIRVYEDEMIHRPSSLWEPTLAMNVVQEFERGVELAAI